MTCSPDSSSHARCAGTAKCLNHRDRPLTHIRRHLPSVGNQTIACPIDSSRLAQPDPERAASSAPVVTAVQRQEPVTSTRILVAQSHESWGPVSRCW
jgi:hypothetical protein